MGSAPPIRFTADAWSAMRLHSEAAYPFEGCGILVGAYGAEKRVEKLVPLTNQFRAEGRGRFDFSFSSLEFAQAQLAADRDKLDVIGIFHTHPDHPPRPSPTDSAQPMLAGWINVIAQVVGDGRGYGRFREAKAWWREDEQKPFLEVELVPPAVA